VIGFLSHCESGVFELKTGGSIAMPDIGALRLSVFSGYAFSDTDGNGAKSAGEATLGGVLFSLVPARSELDTQQVATDADGRFEMTLIRPGEYTLVANAPDGMVFSKDAAGAYVNRTGESEAHENIAIVMGQDTIEQAFGVTEPGAVEGLIFLDMNNDGEMDADENLLTGIEVVLYDEIAEMDAAQTAVLDDGSFGFTGVLPSTYSVYVPIPERHRQAEGSHLSMADNGEGRLAREHITLASGEHYADLVGGLVRLTDWGGTVYIDDGGENRPLAGVTVGLADETGSSLLSMVTGEDGAYAFGELLPGNYRITAELPQGYVLVSPIDPDAARQRSIVRADNSGSAASEIITLVMGQDETDMEIISVRPGSIGDKAWFDENGNGLQDTGERPVAGVVVTLMRDGIAVMETTTNDYGHFMLSDIYPSLYQVQITIPQGLKPTQQRTDLKLLASIMPQTAGDTVLVQDVRIESGVVNRALDLGFVLTQNGQVPSAVKQIEKQRWQ
jgi:Predicted outer membrane protein